MNFFMEIEVLKVYARGTHHRKDVSPLLLLLLLLYICPCQLFVKSLDSRFCCWMVLLTISCLHKPATRYRWFCQWEYFIWSFFLQHLAARKTPNKIWHKRCCTWNFWYITFQNSDIFWFVELNNQCFDINQNKGSYLVFYKTSKKIKKFECHRMTKCKRIGR